MNFLQFLLILKARIKVFFFSFFIFLTLGILYVVFMPPTYKSTATLILNYKGVDPVTGLTLPAQLMPGYMATQVNILSSHRIATAVVDKLALTTNPLIIEKYNEEKNNGYSIRDWTARLISKGLEVVPSRDSSIIDISYFSPNPDFSAYVTNAFASVYVDESLKLDVEPSKKAAVYLKEKITELRKKYELAQKSLYAYQKAKGITNIIENYDSENAKLQNLSMQLAASQSQSLEAQSRKNNAMNDAELSPDIAGNTLILNLKSSLSVAEGKFAQVSKRFAPNHPEYIAAKSELDQLRSDLIHETAKTKQVVSNSATIYTRRSSDLEKEIETQKRKVLELNSHRDELYALERDVQSAKEAYEAASQRLAVSEISGNSNQSSISILNDAISVAKPYRPSGLIAAGVSLFLAIFFGLAGALFLEWRDRRVRSVYDLETYLDIPVLIKV
jgi:polysaccharide biosynthesis transport protein